MEKRIRINELFTCKVNGNGLPVGIYKTSAGRYNSSYNGKNIGTFDTLEEALNYPNKLTPRGKPCKFCIKNIE